MDSHCLKDKNCELKFYQLVVVGVAVVAIFVVVVVSDSVIAVVVIDASVVDIADAVNYIHNEKSKKQNKLLINSSLLELPSL
jgi:hypothetical protein